MSWDAELVGQDPELGVWIAGGWNYTHNCNRMVNDAIGKQGQVETWWRILNGMDGPSGAAFLAGTIDTLEAQPERYRAMDPENGWGSYDTLLPVLRSMRDAVPDDARTTWQVSG